ncbi:MAG: acyl-CoA thioesterase [Phycisphaerae bacterium]|nr:acyl-CoA thioesterase [Phycisphaerae bacterium]
MNRDASQSPQRPPTPKSVLQVGTEIRVRYCECDPMNVAHHSVYPIWFEMGRTELLRASGRTYREFEEAGIFLAVVSLSIKYKRPAKYDDLLTLITRLRDVGHVKIEHTYELRRGDDVLATGESTLACLDREGRARPLPELLRAGIGGRAAS